MNREILFRGKRADNGEWVCGYLYQDGLIGCNIFQTKPHLAAYIVDPSTVCQYTGLTDKNDMKIFEGDILKQKTTDDFKKYNSIEWERCGIVRFGYYDWEEGRCGCATMCWYIEHLRSKSIHPDNYEIGRINPGLNQHYLVDKYYPFEVIGNIFDNPELLEDKA